METSRSIGDKGELIAKRYLESIGIEIIEVNFTIKGGEIDIIGKNNGKYIFYEVKYRKTPIFGTPEESLTKSKKKNILKSINFYCMKNGLSIDDVFFDFIAIDYTGTKPHIKHYKNISLL